MRIQQSPAMLEDLRGNIEKLIALYEAEKTENVRLAEELRKSEQTGAELREKISELESEIETRNLKDAFNGGMENPLAKKRLDSLVREIDKCISLLEEA